MKLYCLFLAILFFVCYGCSKDDEITDPDSSLAEQVAGYYDGSWHTAGVSLQGGCNVVKTSGSRVKFEMTVGSSEIPDSPPVKLEEDKTGKITFSSEEVGTGYFSGNELFLVIEDGMYFSGFKVSD